MNKETATKRQHSDDSNKAAHSKGHDASATIETVLPTGSWQRMAAGVAAAAGGGLIAAAVVGVGPAALAGAAGYLAYRGLKHDHNPAGHKN